MSVPPEGLKGVTSDVLNGSEEEAVRGEGSLRTLDFAHDVRFTLANGTRTVPPQRIEGEEVFHPVTPRHCQLVAYDCDISGIDSGSHLGCAKTKLGCSFWSVIYESSSESPLDGRHVFPIRAPKRAEPILTRVAPSSIATS